MGEEIGDDDRKGATRAACSSAPACSLLPCPFCGPVEIVHQWDGNIEIKHKDDCLLKTMRTLYGSKDIAAWNRRANAQRETLREAP
jgi:hypothetical protein